MKELSTLETIFLNKGIQESQLVLLGKYIEIYTGKLCSIYNVSASESEFDMMYKNMSWAMLDLLLVNEKTINISVQKQVNDIINDFEKDVELAIGNILMILNHAKENEDTNTDLIETVYSVFLPENLDLAEQPDLSNI